MLALIVVPAFGQTISAAPAATANMSAYATKADVDSKIAAAAPNLSSYATTSQVDARVANVAAQIPDLSPYALKTQVPDITPLARSADVSSQITSATAALASKTSLSAVEAKIPLAASSVPPSEMIGGAVGTAGTYRPADAAAPRITRAGVSVTSSSTGDWSITWSTPLAAVPVVLPVPVNSSGTPVVCNVNTRSTTGAAGRCWLARTLPATLTVLTTLVSYDIFASPAAGISVQVLAIPPTQ